MHRRSVLALLGAVGTAGCSTVMDSSGASTPSSTPTDESPTPPDETAEDPDDDLVGSSWSLVEFETVPVTVSVPRTEHRFRDGARVALQFARTATADGPALLRGSLTNANDYENTFELTGLPLFSSVPTAWPGGRPREEQYSYRDELVLAPTGNHDVAAAEPVVVATDGRWRLAEEIDGPWLPERLRLGAGESVQFEYALVGRKEGEGFPRARYHFDGSAEGDEVVVAVWDTARPGPAEPSLFEGADVDPLPDVDDLVWSHEADASSTGYLQPSRESVELPARVEFEYVNHGREQASGNPYFWRLWKHVDGEWFHIAPWVWPLPITTVAPGGRESWSLAAFPEQVVACDDATEVGYLGGGRYAFEVGIGRGTRSHAALLSVEAPPVSVEPVDGLVVERDGTTVRVEWPRREGEVERATLTVTSESGAEGRLLPEQVMRQPNAALRNTLPFFEGDVEDVVLETDRNTVSRGARTGGYEDGSFAFRFEGEGYEATAEFGG